MRSTAGCLWRRPKWRETRRNGDGSFSARVTVRRTRHDRSRAESETEQALEVSPDDADTRWAAAVTYETLGEREKTLVVLKAAPRGVLGDLNHWPDVADLHQDPRFLELLASHQNK